jgi:hypothetical protein
MFRFTQEAVLCLAKTTSVVFYSRRCRRSQCYGGISACCVGVRLNRTREPKHVGANVRVLTVLTFLRFYDSVHQLE